MNIRLLAPAQSELDEAINWYDQQASVIYGVENGDLIVFAIAHQHRKPLYWRDR